MRVSVCHCFACQQRTGSAFGVQARFPADRVSLRGEARTWTRIGDEGHRIAYRFCPTCGSTVLYEIEGVSGAVAVPVGGFADPGFPPPKVEVYEHRRHPWLSVWRAEAAGQS